MTKDISLKNFRDISQDYSTDVIKSKGMNRAIMSLGSENKWRDIISLYHDNKRDIKMANIATIYAQLSKLNSVNKNLSAF
jgi:hypothetical protein